MRPKLSKAVDLLEGSFCFPETLRSSSLRVTAASANAIHHRKWDHYGDFFLQTQHYNASITAVAIMSTSALPELDVQRLLSVPCYILPFFFFFLTGDSNLVLPPSCKAELMTRGDGKGEDISIECEEKWASSQGKLMDCLLSARPSAFSGIYVWASDSLQVRQICSTHTHTHNTSVGLDFKWRSKTTEL